LRRAKILPNHYPSPYPWHIKAWELKDKMGSEFFEYYRFGFSRDPWDWQVSLYLFMKNNPVHKQHKLIASLGSFEEYIEWRINEDLELQKSAFYDHDGNCLMDFIGKLEYLNDDFNYICEKLNLEATLPHINRSNPGIDYLDYYDQRLIDAVYEAYLPDIIAFDYSKPELETIN